MLQPKRTKFRKAHKGRIHGDAKGGSALNFGAFGLKALAPDRITARQIEAARRAPKLLPRAFRRLFATIEGDRLAQFMMDRTGPLETLPVLAASVLGALEGLGDAAPLETTRIGNLAAR